MGQSILVIETPENCRKCPLNNDDFCNANNNCTLKYTTYKPKWCPLKEVPERYNNISCDGSPFYHMCVGWNSCIDEIMGDIYDDI